MKHGSTRELFTYYYCHNPHCGHYRNGTKIPRSTGDPAALEAEIAALKAENEQLRQQLADPARLRPT